MLVQHRLLGRSNIYGFYISVFDTDKQTHHSWPYDIKKQSYLQSLVRVNGETVSTDRSLPEFNFTFFNNSIHGD